MVAVMRWVFLAVFATVSAGALSPAHANSKYAAYVAHAHSGDILFDRYSTQRRYPASLTKMMTLYLLFDELEAGRLTLDSKLTVSAQAAAQPPSKLGVKKGSKIDVETAIEALVVKSANDVAVVVAEQISGSEWRFASKMTAKARALGMRRTTFRNASGLPNRKQVTTARDMATLGRRLMQDHPEYWKYFSTKKFTWNGRTYRTHNALVRTFDGADGVKTGYTRRSGYNLVTTVERDGHHIIGVVLGGRSGRTRDAHMREILTKGFAAIKRKPTLIAALHRNRPEPSLKPTILAQRQREQDMLLAAFGGEIVAPSAKPPANEASSALANAALQSELDDLAAVIASENDGAASNDAISALIAAADNSPEDFNAFERTRLAALNPDVENAGEGDIDPALNWSVQIGAFSSKALAQQELEAAAVAGALTDRSRAVLPMDGPDGKTLFRARF
ncbi:MAG: D-alanyl-D-alanine carboxypeptidase family protein, partial [Pseudomonadota bacterium]